MNSREWRRWVEDSDSERSAWDHIPVDDHDEPPAAVAVEEVRGDLLDVIKKLRAPNNGGQLQRDDGAQPINSARSAIKAGARVSGPITGGADHGIKPGNAAVAGEHFYPHRGAAELKRAGARARTGIYAELGLPGTSRPVVETTARKDWAGRGPGAAHESVARRGAGVGIGADGCQAVRAGRQNQKSGHGDFFHSYDRRLPSSDILPEGAPDLHAALRHPGGDIGPEQSEQLRSAGFGFDVGHAGAIATNGPMAIVDPRAEEILIRKLRAQLHAASLQRNDALRAAAREMHEAREQTERATEAQYCAAESQQRADDVQRRALEEVGHMKNELATELAAAREEARQQEVEAVFAERDAHNSIAPGGTERYASEPTVEQFIATRPAPNYELHANCGPRERTLRLDAERTLLQHEATASRLGLQQEEAAAARRVRHIEADCNSELDALRHELKAAQNECARQFSEAAAEEVLCGTRETQRLEAEMDHYRNKAMKKDAKIKALTVQLASIHGLWADDIEQLNERYLREVSAQKEQRSAEAEVSRADADAKSQAFTTELASVHAHWADDVEQLNERLLDEVSAEKEQRLEIERQLRSEIGSLQRENNGLKKKLEGMPAHPMKTAPF